MIRETAVSGTFYPANAEALRREVARYSVLKPPQEKTKALGIVVPHAGYMYSGHVAGAVYARIELPRKVVILCPNHTGYGAYAAINRSGAWRTPLGEAAIDVSLATRLLELAPLLKEDTAAHRREHSLEVQLPFLQALRPDFQFVPLCLSHFYYAECEALGRALAQLARENGEILLVASSDLNHYESQQRTLAKDQRAIDCILALDAQALYRTVHEENISMCGVIPVTCMLIAARELGAKRAELVKHATSGDVTGDFSGVVGYAGVILA